MCMNSHSFILFLLLKILFLQIFFGKYLLWTLILFNASLCRAVNKILSEVEMQTALDLYNKEAIELCQQSNVAQWNVATDVGNKEKEAEKVSFSEVAEVRNPNEYTFHFHSI